MAHDLDVRHLEYIGKAKRPHRNTGGVILQLSSSDKGKARTTEKIFAMQGEAEISHAGKYIRSPRLAWGWSIGNRILRPGARA